MLTILTGHQANGRRQKESLIRITKELVLVTEYGENGGSEVRHL